MIYLKNLIMNGIPLAAFLYGILALGPYAGSVLNFALGAYVMLILISFILPYVPPAILFETKYTLKQFENTMILINKIFNKPYQYFNVILDLTIAGTFVYFGFDLLAAFYIVHVMAYLVFGHNIKNYILESFEVSDWGKIPSRLAKALENGQTEFSVRELMKNDHAL